MKSLLTRVRAAKCIFVIGNGGSYANAMHIVNDLLSVGKPAFAMDPATLTAFANDHGYEDSFARWIRTVGRDGDMLIALSGSGKSPNILNAISDAERQGMDVWREFGTIQGLGMQDAEEKQLGLGHELMKALRDPC